MEAQNHPLVDIMCINQGVVWATFILFARSSRLLKRTATRTCG
jgi:hypothetical protein